MVEESIKQFSQALGAEFANGKYVGLFMIALFYLWFRGKEKENITLFALSCSILVFNPLVFWVFIKIFPTIGHYGKLMWVIPVPLVLAYTAVEIYAQREKQELVADKKRDRILIKGIVTLFLLIIIASSGTILPYKANLTKWKYQNDSLERALSVVKGQEENYNDKIVLLAPDDMMATSRAYSENIYPLYGKDLWMKEANAEVADDYSPEIYQLYEKMKVDYNCPNEIAVLAERYGCNVLVLRERITEEIGELYHKWELVEEIPGYLIYNYRQ